ncbi:outer membrane beta-barrel protein, partial [Spirosoma litoris]
GLRLGYIGLYTLFYPEGRLTSAIRLPDKTFVPLRGNLTLLMLTKYLTECSDSRFSNLLRPQSFLNTIVYIERVVNTYNQCVNPGQSQSQSRPKKRFRYEAGLSANALVNSWAYGVSDPKNTTYYNPNGVYSSFYTATIGAFFTVAPRKRLSASIEFLASHYKGNLSVPLTNPLDPTAQNTRLYSFEEHFLSLPILGRYVFIDKATRLYLKGGVVPTMRTSISGRFVDSQYSIEIPFLHQTNVGIGYLAGIGADIPLTKKQRMYLEFRTMPHFVLDAVSRIATSRSLQLTISVPLIKHE